MVVLGVKHPKNKWELETRLGEDSLPLERLCHNWRELSFRASPASLPRTRYGTAPHLMRGWARPEIQEDR
jgi:hypothetical protein